MRRDDMPVMARMTIEEVLSRLTPRKRRIYDYILEYSKATGKFPELRKISDNSGIVLSAARSQVLSLARLGLIEIDKVGGKSYYRVAGLKVVAVFDKKTKVLVDEEHLYLKRGPKPRAKVIAS